MTFTRLLSLAILTLLVAPTSVAQWSAQPGETKRNAFGPLRGDKACNSVDAAFRRPTHRLLRRPRNHGTY